MEQSSGERKRYGAISKAGNRLLRFLLGEAAHWRPSRMSNCEPFICG